MLGLNRCITRHGHGPCRMLGFQLAVRFPNTPNKSPCYSDCATSMSSNCRPPTVWRNCQSFRCSSRAKRGKTAAMSFAHTPDSRLARTAPTNSSARWRTRGTHWQARAHGTLTLDTGPNRTCRPDTRRDDQSPAAWLVTFGRAFRTCVNRSTIVLGCLQGSTRHTVCCLVNCYAQIPSVVMSKLGDKK